MFSSSVRVLNISRAPLKRAVFGSVCGNGKQMSSLVNADEGSQLTHLYHKSGKAMAVLLPVALLVPNLPTDLALGAIIPFHSHVAFNYVISDYIPKQFQVSARWALLAASIVAAAGILKLNVTGKGLTKSVLSLWRESPDDFDIDIPGYVKYR